MGVSKAKPYKLIIKSMGQVLALSKLYNQGHPVVKAKMNEVFNQILKLITETGPLVFAESPEATLLVNGEEVKEEDSLMKRFIQDFRNLKLGSLDLKYGLTIEELGTFIDLLNNPEKVSGNLKIREYLKNNGSLHLEPSFAAYKLVNENEIVVKEDEVARLSDIPEDKINAFIQCLSLGNLDNRALKEDKAYSLLAHDPAFLCKVITDKPEYYNSPENFTKILWVIGDYLIGEIESVRQEELNRKIINELKEKLVVGVGGKNIPKEGINRTLVAISATLQLKGLILLLVKGINPDIYLCGNISKVKGEANVNLGILLRLKKQVFEINPDKLKKVEDKINRYNLIIDALLGVGAKGVVSGITAGVISIINKSKAYILSVDIPSGLDASTGRILGNSVKADKTITFVAKKRVCLILKPEGFAAE